MRRGTLARAALAALAGLASEMSPASEQAGSGGASTIGVALPPGYRDWKLISAAHEEGTLNDFRAILGNDVAVNAAREGKFPFPDGAIIARLAWGYVPLAESAAAFGHAQTYVAGAPTNVQLMAKDSQKYAATGGWGFAQFNDGKPVEAAMLSPCFACHQTVKDRDFVFNRYSP